MDSDTNLHLSLISGAGMIAVAVVAVIYWLHMSHLGWRWLWIGAGQWAVAVFFKFAFAIVANGTVIGHFAQSLPYLAFVIVGGLFIGLESSICEIGFTWLAGRRWPSLGQDADRAIGVGIGAGAFEAFLLGLVALISMIATLSNQPGTAPARAAIDHVATLTPLFWLVGPVERIIAVICHGATRALVLLGVTHRRTGMILVGFTIFTLLDSVAGAAQLSGQMDKVPMWWFELAFAPLAIVSLPLLSWCRRNWPQTPAASEPIKNP